MLAFARSHQQACWCSQPTRSVSSSTTPCAGVTPSPTFQQRRYLRISLAILRFIAATRSGRRSRGHFLRLLILLLLLGGSGLRGSGFLLLRRRSHLRLRASDRLLV